MAVVSMKALLESGVHFGHRTNKWDPRMRPYIFTERNGIHIIDLQQTVKALTTAYNYVRDLVANRGVVLFVGTKRQAQETISEEAARCGMPYVTERWLGGMLTNWSTIHQRIQELERLEQLQESGEINRLTKKEGLLIQREIDRLERRLSGVRNMKRLPDAVFVVDVCREETAVHEANLLSIPVVALVDTNCNPNHVDYVIPSNDDAIRAIKLLVGKMADAVLEGKSMRKEEEALEAEEQLETGLAHKTRRVDAPAELEDELEDEALLGEATLAKLTRAADEEEEAGEQPAVESEPEPQADAAPEPVVEPQPAPEKEAKPQTKKKAEPKAEKEAKPKAKETKPAAEKKTKPETKKKAEPKAEKEPKPKTGKSKVAEE
jgi:small subunit ribosomal protein S2